MSKASLQYNNTGIQKYVMDWLGSQIGGTEEPPPQLTRRSGIRVLMRWHSVYGDWKSSNIFGSWKHQFIEFQSKERVQNYGVVHTSPTTKTFSSPLNESEL